jgi:D-aspartate ligase
MANPPAVILGGITNALSVARGLGTIGVKSHAVGPPNSPVSASRHCASFMAISEPDVQRKTFDWLLNSAPRGAVLLPCDDDSLELVVQRRRELVEVGHKPVYANDDVVSFLLDKERTYDIAGRCNVGAPRTVTLRSASDLEHALREISLPSALKPLHIHEFARHFRRKVILVRSESELRAAYKRTSELDLAMLLTEIIPGSEDRYWSYYTYVDSNGRCLVDFTKQKIRQYPIGFGGATYHVTKWNPQIAEAGKRFVEGADVRGVAGVEFKIDSRDGEPKIMECNARVTAANELVRAAGIDLGIIAYQDAADLPISPFAGFRDGVRLWYPLQDWLAFRGLRRTGEITFPGWVGSLAHKQRFPVFSAADPLPAARGLVTFPGRVMAKLRRAPEASSDPGAAFS